MTDDVRIVLTRSALRTPRREDAPSIARLANNRRVWRNVLDAFPHPYGLADADAFLATTLQRPAQTLAIEVDGAAVGMLGLHSQRDVHRGTFEIGYWLGEPYWGRGIVTEAVIAAVEYAFATFPEIRRLEAGVFAWNPASARVLEKAGFTLEGRRREAITKDGEVTDELMFALLRSDRP